MLRKEFAVGGTVAHASVCVTGLGLFELRINGVRVGDRLLAPEWTLYGTRLQYQTFEVTDLIRAGANAVGAQLSGGWWTGPAGATWVRRPARCCLLLRLDLELRDGSRQTVVTDSTWQATNDGPIRRAGIYYGEEYDATRELPGWDRPGFAAAGWSPVAVLPHPDGAPRTRLVAQCNEPIRVVKEVRPVRMTEPEPGVYVYDMGQNMVGWCRLRAKAPAGALISLRHAETLNEDGTLYTANLRKAAQRDQYRWRGGEAVVEPHFTYHGFRYVELTGLPAAPAEDALVGRVFHSAAPDAGTFACSNDLVDAVMRCVEWGLRGNLMSVPTDCPQRDERMGFLGDFQSFSQTAIFTLDLAGFLTKWVRDIRDSQLEDGRFPVIAPHPREPSWLRWANTEFSPAWSDAGTIVPWRAYLNYADTRLLEEHFEACKRWIEFVRANNPDLVWRNCRGGDQGDWLNGDMTELPDYPSGISAVPKELFATAFFAHSTAIVARMAGVLGRTDDAREHGVLAERIKAAFNREFVAADGRVSGDTQGGYALALHFGLLDEALRAPATRHLLAAIDRYHGHPSTGIHATHRMLLELTRNGRHDEAWRLMNLRTVPSWGYMVDQECDHDLGTVGCLRRGPGALGRPPGSANELVEPLRFRLRWRVGMARAGGHQSRRGRSRLPALRDPPAPVRRAHLAQGELRLDSRQDHQRVEGGRPGALPPVRADPGQYEGHGVPARRQRGGGDRGRQAGCPGRGGRRSPGGGWHGRARRGFGDLPLPYGRAVTAKDSSRPRIASRGLSTRRSLTVISPHPRTSPGRCNSAR